jgi:hypothetical protein
MFYFLSFECSNFKINFIDQYFSKKKTFLLSGATSKMLFEKNKKIMQFWQFKMIFDQTQYIRQSKLKLLKLKDLSYLGICTSKIKFWT